MLQLSEKQSWTTASLSCLGTLQISEKTKLGYIFNVPEHDMEAVVQLCFSLNCNVPKHDREAVAQLCFLTYL
jgi:hypothetical protein